MTRSRTKSPAIPAASLQVSQHSPQLQQQNNTVLNSPTKGSPTSPTHRHHSHQIKYVMPAEQPMEKLNKIKMKNLMDETNVVIPGDLLRVHQVKDNSIQLSHSTKVEPKKSWAEVLEEQLDPYNKNNRMEKSPPQEKTEEEKTKKKKKRNITRCSILERIYGKDIYLKDEDDVNSPDRFASQSNTIIDSFLNTDDSNRPLPTLDEKVVDDLMSFNDNSDSDMELDDTCFFSFSKTTNADCNDPMEMKDERPRFQSTLLRTPVDHDTSEKVELIRLTPVTDTDKRQPVAPCKQLTKARTPYKQAMLDILHRTLAEAKKKKKEQEDVLNCTVAVQNDTTSPSDKTLVEASLDNNEENIEIAKIIETAKLVSISDSTLQDGKTPVKSTPEPMSIPSTPVHMFPMPSLKVPNLNSPNMRKFSNNNNTNINEPQQRNSFTKVLPSTNTYFTTTKESSSIISYASSQIPGTLSSPLRIIKPAVFTINHRNSPVVSSKKFESSLSTSSLSFARKPTSQTFPSGTSSFPVAPLFNGLSQNIKFADTKQPRQYTDVSTKSFHLKQSAFGVLPNSRTKAQPSFDTGAAIKGGFPVAPLFSSLSQGIKFSHQEEPVNNTNDSAVKKSNSLINETTILDNSDVCMIFGKNSKVFNKSESSQFSSSSFLKPSTFSNSIGAEGGAFRPVKAPTITEPIPVDEVALNTEVEVYSKIGELYKDKLDQANNIRKTDRFNGAFNIVAKLLLHGDSKVRTFVFPLLSYYAKIKKQQ